MFSVVVRTLVMRSRDYMDSPELSHLDSLKKNFFLIYSFLVVLSVAVHRLFPSCGKQGLLSSCGAQASHCCGFSFCKAWSLEHAGFSGCGTWA